MADKAFHGYFNFGSSTGSVGSATLYCTALKVKASLVRTEAFLDYFYRFIIYIDGYRQRIWCIYQLCYRGLGLVKNSCNKIARDGTFLKGGSAPKTAKTVCLGENSLVPCSILTTQVLLGNAPGISIAIATIKIGHRQA